MSAYTVFGIPNCDTIKKTKNWLTSHGIDFDFHNYKAAGISEKKLAEWLTVYPVEKIINRAGTTWKKLSDAEKEAASTAAGAIELMTKQPSVIKRPIIEDAEGQVVAIGFSEPDFQTKFLK